jgi:hypothetical protein
MWHWTVSSCSFAKSDHLCNTWFVDLEALAFFDIRKFFNEDGSPISQRKMHLRSLSNSRHWARAVVFPALMDCGWRWNLNWHLLRKNSKN